MTLPTEWTDRERLEVIAVLAGRLVPPSLNPVRTTAIATAIILIAREPASTLRALRDQLVEALRL